MKIYVLIKYWYYESPEIIGIYDSMENAVKAESEYPKKNNYNLNIEEYELNETYPNL